MDIPDPKALTDGLKAAEGLATQLAVKDLVQPAAKELGEGAGLAIHGALAPLRLFVLGISEVENYISSRLKERFASIPAKRIIEPAPSIAVPALQAISYTATSEPTLAAMYADLLGTAMDVETASIAHPAFVGIIQQMTPDEAKLIARVIKYRFVRIIEIYVAISAPVFDEYEEGLVNIFVSHWHQLGVRQPQLIPSMVENLRRLGLVEFEGIGATGPLGRNWPLNDRLTSKHQELLEAVTRSGVDCTGNLRAFFQPTELGRRFVEACAPLGFRPDLTA